MILIHPTVLKKCSLMSGGLVQIRSASSKVVSLCGIVKGLSSL